jgi:hypothetical protein
LPKSPRSTGSPPLADQEAVPRARRKRVPEVGASVDDGISRLRAAQEVDSVPVVYFNGFASLMSAGDVTVVLERNNRPAGVLNMSFTVAKSLSVSLGGLVSALEAAAERDMLTTFDIEKMFEKEAGQ